MHQDKALKKILKTNNPQNLPCGFEERVMKAIHREAEKAAGIKYAWNIALVSGISLVIIAGVIFVILHFYSFRFSFALPRINLTEEGKPLFIFSLYIASIVLILLGLDAYIRRLLRKIN